jgi:predicted aspartyl protease
MWGQPVEQHLELIKVYEFLDTGFDEHYIIVTPFIVDYLQQTIQSNDKDTFINKICADYCVLLKNLYGIISIDAPRSSSHNSKPMSDKMPV